MMRAPALVAAAVAMTVPCATRATCWLVGNLAGQSYKVGSAYRGVPDSLGSQVFSVTIDGNRGALAPAASDMACTPSTPTLLSCTMHVGAARSIELWSIDLANRKVVFTKVQSGGGIFDGASVLVGDVLGQCK